MVWRGFCSESSPETVRGWPVRPAYGRTLVLQPIKVKSTRPLWFKQSNASLSQLGRVVFSQVGHPELLNCSRQRGSWTGTHTIAYTGRYVCDSGNGPFLNSEDMRTRLICSGCVVYTNCMRSLFSPLYVSQKRCPLTSLASGATIEQTFKQVDTEGPFGSVWVAQSSGQPAVGCQVLKALGVLASKANSTFLIVAGDSLYMFRSKDLDSTAIKKRVDAVTPML